MTDRREAELYDRITDLLDGCPTETIIPVICEALVHALNCATTGNRLAMRDRAIECLQDYVTHDHPVKMVVTQ